MTGPTTPDLLTFFEIPKPKELHDPEKPGSTVSKPNAAKVPHLTKSLFIGMLVAQSGMGTLLAVALELLQLVIYMILSTVDEDQFAKTKETMLGQITILTEKVKPMSRQAAEAAFNQAKSEIEAMANHKKSPEGAVVDQPAGEGETLDAEKAAAAQLADLLNTNKKTTLN